LSAVTLSVAFFYTHAECHFNERRILRDYFLFLCYVSLF
jgi:hypothetical protein